MSAFSHLKPAARHVGTGAHVAAPDTRLIAAMRQSQTHLETSLREHRDDLAGLRRDLARHRSGGAFPWSAALLLGAGYALYRQSPELRERVRGLLSRVTGVQGNLTRAADAAKDAASDLTHGQNPSDAFQRTAGEMKRAGEKAVDGVADTWRSAADAARRTADDVKAAHGGGRA